MSADQYLSRNGYPKDEADLLENHRLVGRTITSDYVPWWSDFTKKAKKYCYQSNSVASLLEVIKNGLGIGIMPKRFKDEGFVYLDNINCEFDANIYLVAHKSTKDIPKIRCVINFYKEIISEM